ncbi:MAG: DnaA regulatory inactivator Hda [Cellvibrionaceae bacterium]
MLSQQLPLGIRLQDDATLDNFIASPHSPQEQVKSAVSKLLTSPSQENTSLFLCGPTASGVSHLLQAACQWADAEGFSSQYFPLSELLDFPPQALFEGLENMAVVCLDDVQAIAGKPEWEQALFHFFNRVRDAGNVLLLGADQVPGSLAMVLPDLQSRLLWGGVFQLPALTDEQKAEILQQRANKIGMAMPEDVARFLLQRGPRSMAELIDCLRQLDEASLAEQRKLTVPFVKKVLGL